MNEMRKIVPAVFMTSMAGLAFEVLLTRIFSVSLWYHFAFMIISVAMLGLAASGTVLSLSSRLQDSGNTGLYTFCLGISMPASYLLTNLIPFDPVRLAWEKAEILYLGLYYVLLAIPFFFVGLVIATAFTTASGKSGLVYGADLLGAGLGSLGVLVLMGTTSPEHAVFILSMVVLAVSFPVCGKRLRVGCALFITANLFLLLLWPGFTALRMSPYKELPTALRYPGAEMLHTYHTPFARIDTFRSPAVRFAPGLSLSWLEPLPEQIGFAVDGGNTSAVTGIADRKALAFLSRLPAALPYETGERDKVLVLDPGGGLQVLLARYYGARGITGVETNPWLAEIMRKDFGAFSGNIYGENIKTGLGRSWLAVHGGTFDLIDISPQGAEPAGSFGIAEDYRFTVEAFREYLRHLDKDGVLCINLFIIPPPRYELRMLATLTTAMESMGIRHADRHIAAIRSWDTISILAKKSPLTGKETAAIRKFAGDRWFDLLLVPGIKAEESGIHIKMPSSDYVRAFQAVLSPERRGKFLQEYLFNVSPVYDQSPFYHYFLKIPKIREIYRVMGGKWQFFLEAGYIVPALLLQAAALSALLLIVPAVAIGRKEGYNRGGGKILPYFAFLGMGYMLVEIPFIQKMILPLENPSYAVAAVLAAILLSSGAGSLASSRFAVLRNPATIAFTSLLIVAYGFLMTTVSSVLAQYRPPLSFLLVFLTFFPVGFLMGIPFPTGLKALGERNPRLIPWAWAINGCFSVLGPLCAILLAMAVGFRNVLLIGALCYLLAFLNLSAWARSNAGLR
jgi:spermidine synthase